MKALPVLVTREQALRRFAGGLLQRWRSPRKLQRGAPRVELVYLRELGVVVRGEQPRRLRRGWLAANAAVDSLLLLGADPPSWESIDESVVLDLAADPEAAARMLKRHFRSARFQRGAWLLEPLAHPYWVYYVPRSGDRLDVRLLDAVSGRPTAIRLKLAFLEALVAQSRVAPPANLT